MKKWVLGKTDKSVVDMLLKNTDISDLCAEILVSRGLTDLDDISEFFMKTEISDPFLLKDMDKAIESIRSAIDKFELICIYGDYDCDGITSTAILYDYITNCGGNVMYYIPEREDGYGLNNKAIEYLADEGVNLVITVDNGITAVDEANYIYELGMKLVVTDHHKPSDKLPKAQAVVDPHREDDESSFKNLAGVGVAMKVIAALEDGNYDFVLEQYADIVAIGTVADVVELKGENRAIVQYGLKQLAVTENQGLSLLMQKSGVSPENVSSTQIAFFVAPRINASGRFGSPLTALKCLVSEEDNTEDLVSQLVTLNNQRKKVETQILEDILSQIENDPHIINQRVIVVSGENWHHGVVGIVCSRLIDRFGKPVFVVSVDGDKAKGSARGIEGFNIVECLKYCEGIISKYGGHTLAGGFSLESDKIHAFAEKINEYAKIENDKMPSVSVHIDKILKPDDITVEKVESLKVLEPFGQGNSQPVFCIIGARIERIVSLSNNRHLRIELLYENKHISAMLFNTSSEKFSLHIGELADFIVNAEINFYNNRKNVSLKIKDYRKHGLKQEKYFAAKACYEAFCRDEEIQNNLSARIVPSREDLVLSYKYFASKQNKINVDTAFADLNSDSMNYCKLKLCIDILSELNLLNKNVTNDTVDFVAPTTKVDLESSHILKKLRCLM